MVAANDVLTDKQVAIKKVANAFEDMVDAKRILREVRLMRQFNHPNVVKLYDIMEPPSIETFEDLYIVTELMSTDTISCVSTSCGYELHQFSISSPS